MKRGFLLTVLAAGMLGGCSGGRERSGQADSAVATADVADTIRVTVTQAEILIRLADLKPQVRQNPPRIPSSTQKALTRLGDQPVSTILLSMDNEAMIAFEFTGLDTARRMDDLHEDGFAYRNWYFSGLITLDLTREMQQALGS